jgi:subtilisin family serine protease
MSRKSSALRVITGLVAWGLLIPAGVAVTAPAGMAPTSTVTLLTGDKVTLGGQRGATVLPALGRERIGFHQSKDAHGDIHVVPNDAMPMVRANRIDPRLFNITQLAENGYDDRKRKDIPLIVSGIPNLTATGIRALPSIQSSAVRVDKATGFSQFTSAGRIWLDGPVRVMLDKSIPQVGAPAAWNTGFTGKDTTVAVLDSGIDATHPDLAGAVVKAENFSSATTGPDDLNGHGTHVASIITGEHPIYRGVAPDTKLLNGKVVDDFGFGEESQVITGMQWAAAQGADVVNLSLGWHYASDGTDPMSQAINRLTAETGTLFVVAAGNNPTRAPGPPGAADAALTVGAVDHNDQLAEFSTRGPRFGDDMIKPEITAPGVDIAAAKATHGQSGDPVDATHVRMSGTSMATPHVAGAAAILAGQHPSWHADRIKSALMGSAKPHPALSVFEQGAGRLDVARAVTQTVQAEPASLNAGVAQWPHHDDVPITKTLTYHNSGASEVSAGVVADIRDPAGKPVPAGMFTFSPSTITIPAGGQAQVTVSIDTKPDGPEGLYSGVVVAGDVRTPIAVNREVESYNVTVRFIGADGRPSPDYSYGFTDIDRSKLVNKYNASGTVVARLAKGRHYFSAVLTESVLAAEPEYLVAGDSTIVVDARSANPAGFVVDKPNAKPGNTIVALERQLPSGSTVSSVHSSSGPLRVQPSKTFAPGRFGYAVEAKLAEPDGSGGFSKTTYLYTLKQETDGRIPAEPMHRVRDSQLVKVRSEHATMTPGKYGQRDMMVVKPLPYTLNEFYTPGVPWTGYFFQLDSPGATRDTYLFHVSPRTFTHDTAEKWNFGVLGPAMPDADEFYYQPSRQGDTMVVHIGLHTDQAPGRLGVADDVGSTTLFLDGKQIGTSDISGFGVFEVPPGPRVYSLRTESTHGLGLSDSITADWTFKSDSQPPYEYAPMPLLAVRFAPALDNYNRAPRAIPTLVPITVDHNSGGEAQRPAVQVSHDDGTTWKPLPVLTAGGRWFTVVVHPTGAKSVSLKASARDNEGNSVNQTILRAFHLK